MMITANGIIIRTGLEQIRTIGRNTQGVRLIKLGSGDKLVAVEKIVVENVGNSREQSNTNSKAKSQGKRGKKIPKKK
jgi:DNA gyrase subunit A